MKYTIVCKPVTTEPGAFSGMHFDENYPEFSKTDDAGNEVYEVETERDLSAQLDRSDGVVSYTVS